MQETAGKNAPSPTQEPRGNHRGNAARGTPPTQRKEENATSRPRKETETTHHYRPQQTPTMTTNTDKTRHEKTTETAKKKTGAGLSLGEIEDRSTGRRRSARPGCREHKGKPKPHTGFGFPQRLREKEREREREREREKKTASTKAPDKDKNEGDKQLKNRHGSGCEGLKGPDNNTDPWEITMASQRTDKDLKSQKQKPDKKPQQHPRGMNTAGWRGPWAALPSLGESPQGTMVPRGPKTPPPW